MILNPNFRRLRLRGLTLVELLVVVAIVSLLSAMALPSFRTVMTQRKTNQAGILVRNMLETARARAIARGRPVAVVLERLSSRATRDAAGTLIPSNASSSDYPSNYAAYNSCIRMSLAETPAAIEFDNVTFNLTGGILTLGNAVTNDPRYANMVRPGATIEFPDVPAMTRKLTVTSVDADNDNVRDVDGMSNPEITVNNVATTTDVYNLIVVRQSLYQPLPNIPLAGGFSAATKMIVHPIPQPIASQVIDLPKGTCIDLSLSGLAANERFSVPAGIVDRVNQRDARRQFASDWAYTAATPSTDDPAPNELRPVYLTFGPSGTLESVYANSISYTLSSGQLVPTLTGDSYLQRYDVREDVYLFVGRTDQIVRTTGFAVTIDGIHMEPEELEGEKIQANLFDGHAEWVRISPKSGSISVGKVVPSLEEDHAAHGHGPDEIPIGELLAESRSKSFITDAGAQ